MARGFAGNAIQVRAALSLALSGILFILYPAVRPFSDEKSLLGAQAFASSAWILAHLFAMLAFILLALGLLGLSIALQQASIERLALAGLAVTWLGVGLLLPFYGAEAFGLHAIGQQAVAQHNAGLLSLANDVRTGPGLTIFLIGLILLAIGAIIAAAAIWRSRTLSRWSGVPLAVGLALYIPQFFGTQPIRVAHGVLVAAGCLWVAAGLWQLRHNS